MPPPTPEQTFQLALTHHNAGRLQQAEPLYRQVLALQPNHPDALHMLGVLAAQTNRFTDAIPLLRQAIAARPNFPKACNNLGLALQMTQQLDEAIAAHRQALALQPYFPEACFNLANALKQKNRLDESIAAYRQAIALQPNYAEAYSNLAAALHNKGRFDDSIAACRQALALKPQLSEAHSNLGNSLGAKGQIDPAIAAYRQAIALRPNDPVSHHHLGYLYKQKGQLDQALASFTQALALNPNYAEAHNNLGSVFFQLDRLEDAVAAYRQSIALNPNDPEAHNNLGSALYNLGQLPQADAALTQALTLNPNLAVAHFNRAPVLLLQGQLQQGFEEYEWRWRWNDFPSPPRNFSQPLFYKQDPAGKTILLHTEQGLGDAIQFARYIPLLAQRGAKVIIECHPPLRELFQSLQGVSSIHNHYDPLPPFDFQAPFLSLPRAFGTTLSTIPANIPYLKPDPQKTAHWKNYLRQHTIKPSPSTLLNIGLVWSGNPSHHNDRRRSISLSTFAPLFCLPHLQFISLQKGPAANQLSLLNLPPRFPKILDPAQELKDLTDTAALLDSLDLLITVDTAVAHLAGALGLSVWTLLPYIPDWRWLQNRADSPWYPTMRLFRQQTSDNWPHVIQSLTQAITEKSPQKSPPNPP